MHLKSQLTEKEDEINQASDSKAKYREYYDDKLAQEIEEAERAKARADELNQRVGDLEDENE
jgi:hypothetical protein